MSLKIVGKLKAPKAWAITMIKSTGHYIVDYLPTAMPFAKLNAEAEEALDELRFCFPDGAPEEYKYRETVRGSPEHEAQNELHRLNNQWNRMSASADRVALDYSPIFEADLTFEGYSRGRSKVIMGFKAANGQEIPFGASGINSLLNHIASGHIKINKGKFNIRFTLEKKGSNIYAYPHYGVAK